jgi:hypothetical protein
MTRAMPERMRKMPAMSVKGTAAREEITAARDGRCLPVRHRNTPLTVA